MPKKIFSFIFFIIFAFFSLSRASSDTFQEVLTEIPPCMQHMHFEISDKAGEVYSVRPVELSDFNQKYIEFFSGTPTTVERLHKTWEPILNSKPKVFQIYGIFKDEIFIGKITLAANLTFSQHFNLSRDEFPAACGVT